MTIKSDVVGILTIVTLETLTLVGILKFVDKADKAANKKLHVEQAQNSGRSITPESFHRFDQLAQGAASPMPASGRGR